MHPWHDASTARSDLSGLSGKSGSLVGPRLTFKDFVQDAPPGLSSAVWRQVDTEQVDQVEISDDEVQMFPS